MCEAKAGPRAVVSKDLGWATQTSETPLTALELQKLEFKVAGLAPLQLQVLYSLTSLLWLLQSSGLLGLERRHSHPSLHCTGPSPVWAVPTSPSCKDTVTLDQD